MLETLFRKSGHIGMIFRKIYQPTDISIHISIYCNFFCEFPIFHPFIDGQVVGLEFKSKTLLHHANTLIGNIMAYILYILF